MHPTTLWPAAAGLAALLVLPAAAFAGAPGCLRVASAAPPDQPIDSYSQHSSTDADGKVQLNDAVTITMGDRTIKAAHVTYDPDTNVLRLVDQILYTDPTLTATGDAGTYLRDDSAAQLTNAHFKLLQQPGRGTAKLVRLNAQNVVRLDQATFTTCPEGETDWELEAREIKLDTDANLGTAKHAKVVFHHVPILYLPWISFPLSSERQSGFLFPSLRSSTRGGVGLSEPYYLNLAPNYDLTLEPTWYARRGASLSTEFRFLGDHNSAELDTTLLPHDRVIDRRRSDLKFTDRLQLPAGWRIDVNAEDVSDPTYLEDFGDGTQVSSTPFLPRQANLSYRDDVWQFDAELLDFQTLDSTLAAVDHPYIESPRLTASALWGLGAARILQWGFDAESVNFTRATGVAAWRTDLKPQLGADFEGAGYFLRPNAEWELTRYELRDNDAATPEDATRSLPILTVDSGLQFERLAGGRGQRSVTLEPRLMYIYIPYRDQSQLPVFDTAPADVNPIELFQANRYVGTDRIGDANEIVAGLTTHMFSTASGTRYLSATFGESFQLEAPRVSLPDEQLETQRHSNLIGQIDLTGFYHWNVQTSLAWNTAEERTDKAQIALQYRPADDKVVNLAYRFQRDQTEQADASLAWPVAKRWDLYGRAVYSLRDHTSIEDFAGFQYRGACWGVRLLGRRSVSTRTGEHDTGIYLQLELNGLSSVGTGTDSFLERSIRGYSASSSSH
ncbi:MAG TPA: LPS assembly protein LptD [Steroidobacteraceae bacterium]|nr:LPS assembly protein LptD [Steroidobacteraceae bacterium]